MVDFNTLNLQIPPVVYTYSQEDQQNIFQYLYELTELDRKAYTIAFNHLESSFNIMRSNGYIKWINSKN